uniref:LytTR family transcriptional regulator n=1 Tax=Muribaculaceae bacterium Z82 TaxID=2304548 RepID=A0A7C9NZ02_9BACT
MRLSVREDPALDDIEVTIACPQVDRRVRRIVEAVEMDGMRLACTVDGYMRMVDAGQVLYAETVDGRTFLYLERDAGETGLSLAQLEEGLAGTEFVRASRQVLVNLAHVRGIRPYLNARLELLLSNGERLVVSRQFAPSVKTRIGF